MEQNNTRENDLPLMANLDTYRVQHYVLDLTCHFSKNILSGTITLFVNQVKSDSVKSYLKNDNLQTKKRKQLVRDEIITEKKQKNCNEVSGCSESNSNKHSDSLNSVNMILDKEHSSFARSGQYLKDYNETESSIARHDIISNNEKMLYIPKLGAGDSSQSNSSSLEEEILPTDISLNDENIKEIIPPSDNAGNVMNEKDATEESAESVNSVTNCLLEQEQYTKVFHADPGINLQSVQDDNNQYKQTVFILDASDIIVSEVTLLHVLWCDKCQNKCFKECETGTDSAVKREEFYHQCSLKTGKAMSFKTDKWSLRIFEEEPTEEFCQNSKIAIKIKYSTLTKGKSLKWVPDQDGNMCMFTCGHWINNRSLFPSQDRSEALSTWQAYVTVDDGYTVIMTGDKQPLVTNTENGKLCYFYQSTMLLPSSTLAIAVGQWEQATITHLRSTGQDSQQNQKWVPEFCATMHGSCSVNYSKTPIPCRVFAPRSFISKAESEFKSYLPKCLTKACNILGPYPFGRLDILITPPCFSCLGLTSPCVIFLSQSVLVGDRSFCNCLAHELCHSWFGLLIGPKDWTEEWMTEGFASFMEDIIHTDLIGLDELFELRAFLKYKLLSAELEHTDASLQIMRPNKDVPEEKATNYIKNGMNPEKKCMQVHYLKGYFLLRYLAQIVGMERFQDFLRVYVTKYHGQLVTSQDFLKLLFDVFPNLSEEGLSTTQIFTEWLDRAGLPVPLLNYKMPTELSLISDVYNQVQLIEKYCAQQKNSKSLEDTMDILNLKPVCQDQIVLFLELLLDVAVPKNILDNIRVKFDICHANPDIQHRWCELLIKNKYAKFYGDIKKFLFDHQAMSTYLYGEMVLSGTKKQISIAKECFKELLPYMEEDLKETLRKMIFG